MSADKVKPFWERKRLDEMSSEEWESLCDGCARCCLQKLEDEDDGEVYYTDIVCKYLDEGKCQCTVYQERHELVPQCIWLKPSDLEHIEWLPTTCAYRVLYEGRPLPEWHPLITGTRDSVHEAQISVRGKVVFENEVPEEDWEDHIIIGIK